MNKPRLLISGDSYMAWHGGTAEARPEFFEEKNRIHWAYKLMPYFDVINVAQPGASNAIILRNLSLAIRDLKRTSLPDYVVLGFTDHGRLEHTYDTDRRMVLTNAHKSVTDNKSVYRDYQGYIRYADLDYMFYKNLMLAEHAIMIARNASINTVFALNGMYFDTYFKDIGNYQHMVDFMHEKLPMDLKGHRESSACTFHVIDETAHDNFAQCILNAFNIDTQNK